MTIKKSKDHIGYGNGMIGYGDVQATSLDSNSPSWMFGMRMVPGVVGSGMPRWNYCQIEDGKLNVKPRYFQRGPNMTTIETVGGEPPIRYDRQIIDYRQVPPKNSAREMAKIVNKAGMDVRKSSLVGSGAVSTAPKLPDSNYKVTEPDHREYWKVQA